MRPTSCWGCRSPSASPSRRWQSGAPSCGTASTTSTWSFGARLAMAAKHGWGFPTWPAAAGGADAMKPGTATWTAGSAWALTVALALLRLRLQLADEPSEAVVDALDALVLLGFATAGALIA